MSKSTLSLINSQPDADNRKSRLKGIIQQKSYSVSASGEVRDTEEQREFQNRRTQREFEARQRL